MSSAPPEVQAPSLASVAQLGGALAFGYAASQMALAGSLIWMVLALGVWLALPLSLFPGAPADRPATIGAALGLYIPVVGAFYALSYGRSGLEGETASWLLVGASVVGAASLARLCMLPAARRALPWFGGALLFGLLIGFFSGARGSGEPWKDFLMERYALDADQAELAVVSLRKTLHVLFYGMLAWLAAKGLRAAGAGPGRAFAFAVLWSIGHAAFDELRQSFSPVRAGSPWDVLLDLGGILLFTSPFWWAAIRQRRRSA